MRNIYVPIIKLLRVKDYGLRRGSVIIPPQEPGISVRRGTIFNKYVIRGAKQ
jgi:hypothetical protein